MTTHGYSFVSDNGLTTFPADLANSAWADVPTLSTDADDSGAAGDVLFGASLATALKWVVLTAIGHFSAALARAPSAATVADEGYDRQQRVFNASLALALLSDDPAVVAAAQRLKDTLTLGDGTGQTALSFQEEVDFGRDQARRAQQPDVAADLATVGLTDRVAHILRATEQLALTLGRIDQDPTLPPYKRLLITRTLCNNTLNCVHTLLLHLTTHAPSAASRAQATRLLAPFQALLARHPATSKPTPPKTPSP